MSDKIDVTLSKEVMEALIFAGINYKNRIMYLESQGKISKYKLNKIKSGTLFNVLKGIDILGLKLCNKCKGTGIFEDKICLNCNKND